MPTEGEIGTFERKVNTKLESTRGVFVSIPGFRPKVINEFCRRGGNIILLDGTHLISIIEGRIELMEMLKHIIERASNEGEAYTPISKLIG